MSGPFRVPEDHVFVNNGCWRVMVNLTEYEVGQIRDTEGRRFITVTRFGRTVSMETRAMVLERCLINLIAPSQPTKDA